MLAGDTHCIGKRPLGQTHRLHELLDKNLTDGRGLTRRHQHGSPHMSVMPALVAGIHVFLGPSRKKTGMAGTSPAVMLWRMRHFLA
jgi:hypothetical protein